MQFLDGSKFISECIKNSFTKIPKIMINCLIISLIFPELLKA